MGRAPCLSRGTTQAFSFGNGFAEVSQAPVSEGRLAEFIVRNVTPGTLGGFRFHLADCFLQRQPLSRDVGFVQCRLDPRN